MRLPSGLELDLVRIEAGPFVAGSDDDSPSERPRRVETIERPFWIGRTPVTQRDYARFVVATGREEPEAPRWGRAPTHPVVFVTWWDARAFCDWAGLDLPTELEWERAARGASGRRYPWGDAPPSPERAVWDGHPTFGGRSTAPVDAHLAGASPEGVLDLAGNAWEWCRDELPSGMRAFRGGGWNFPERFLRASCRGGNVPETRDDDLGFRVVLRT